MRCILRAAEPAGVVTYEFDDIGRLTSENGAPSPPGDNSTLAGILAAYGDWPGSILLSLTFPDTGNHYSFRMTAAEGDPHETDT